MVWRRASRLEGRVQGGITCVGLDVDERLTSVAVGGGRGCGGRYHDEIAGSPEALGRRVSRLIENGRPASVC